MTKEEYRLYLQGAKDFACLIEKELLSKSYEMPNNTKLTYVYTNAIPIAIQNSLMTLDIKTTLNSELKSELN